jgi:predicted methyltransferase
MLRSATFAAASLLAFGLAHAASEPANVKAAVSDSARPESDTKRDAARKPADMLEFAQVKPGEKVVDLLPGGGYFTRLFAVAVGPSGKVYALAPAKPPTAPPDAPDRSAAVKAIAADPHYSNVVVISEPGPELIKMKLPEPVDLIWTSQNYHDVHNIKDVDVAGFNKAVFAALKPGGYFIVLDHAATPGSGANDTSTLHRIDEATVKQEVEAAGFKLVGESKVLRNPEDPHTAKVFDPSVQGHTDQFILKFQRPK